ncbi:PAS domain S-box protein [Leptolyngbya sp. FACHB-261]|uniref:PAS domain S-box protein n=1 Tax=Leptolyngbya sp. FACHB-261 TaxID=2692806 RepID=UPI0016881545|nr:PAS domain-containing protein [Leptolyngbya sp. FACHB-261]MBD2100060.1 PAS domain-containing protein [Leptolyngbya sp. FACHB-261]
MNAQPWDNVNDTFNTSFGNPLVEQEIGELLSVLLAELEGQKQRLLLENQELLLENQEQRLEIQALLLENAKLRNGQQQQDLALKEATTLVQGLDGSTSTHLYSDNENLRVANESLRSRNEQLSLDNHGLNISDQTLNTSNDNLRLSYESLRCDNTELRCTNEELQYSNKQLNRYAEVLSRSFKTLSERSQLLESILLNLQLGIIVLDSQLQVLKWNSQCLELWGLDEREVKGQAFLSLNLDLPTEPLQAALDSLVNAQSQSQKLVSKTTNRRGEIMQCEIVCTRFTISARQGEGVLLIIKHSI